MLMIDYKQLHDLLVLLPTDKQQVLSRTDKLSNNPVLPLTPLSKSCHEPSENHLETIK